MLSTCYRWQSITPFVVGTGRPMQPVGLVTILLIELIPERYGSATQRRTASRLARLQCCYSLAIVLLQPYYSRTTVALQSSLQP